MVRACVWTLELAGTIQLLACSYVHLDGVLIDLASLLCNQPAELRAVALYHAALREDLIERYLTRYVVVGRCLGEGTAGSEPI
jgi:hypothetical protein